MEKNTMDSLKHIGIQFFAESGEGEDPGAHNDGNDGGTNKTYSQEDLNKIAAKEKKTARQALLKELGFEVSEETDYKSIIEDVKKTLDSGKTQQEKDQEARKTAEATAKAATKEASDLKMKVAALSAGVNSDSLDDVITLAKAKVDAEHDIDSVMKTLKEKYPSFFNGSREGSGTGGFNNPPRKKPAGGESYGQRLAKVAPAAKKSSFFKN